ncbi:purine-cytosine permease family protein [Cryptosporangium arvum]|uniref:Purine-cytosine permease-like transporter n=1 Tax=Cryptosporangium arvum DSM 44712 TaxID=927661 RepID=A0A010YGH8_9ACTN|nr:cytosine permease [Cryptosporangium arvum]EXG79345.1 purine-cytosine permease-like transporter [Cryptosporangium arvum DSM 44712]
MSDAALSVEANGINQIAENERKGTPRDLFWPWFAANVSVLGVAYGSYVLGFAISFWQAALVGVLGIVLSFLLVGIISIAGKRGSAPTMTLTRAAFGVRGGRLPSFISWLLTVGWETSLVVVAVLATATILDRLGAGGGTATKVVALIVIVALVALGGALGFNLIMRAQRWITWIAGALTVVYLVFAADHVDFATVSGLPGGSTAAVIGALVFTMTGFGLGWVNAAADYSRYLPRSASTRGVVLWTTLGSSLPPVILLVFGILLAGSSKDLNSAIGLDPVGALTTILPTWFLVPFAVVTILGLVSGAIMDVYSSGLALLNVGLKAPRWVAVCIDSTLMLIGAIYVVFVANDFLGPFQGFLITLGVPIAAWCGIFVADILLRKADYAEAELFTPGGRYGDVRWTSVGLVVVGSAVGWGLVTNTMASWLDWQGYLLGPIGGKDGDWAFANLGVIVSLAIGFIGYLLLGRGAVRAQERIPAVTGSVVTNAQTEGVS